MQGKRPEDEDNGHGNPENGVGSRCTSTPESVLTDIVLAPGPAKDLAEIKKRTGFDFPFVLDRDLQISRALNIARGSAGILPCMFHVASDLRIVWWQQGRNGAYFGDKELEEYFDCEFI